MPIASNIICLWPSTNASIPSGWSRETNLDGKYIQGSAAGADGDLTTARGNTSHNHTSPSHTPTQASHTHLVYGDVDSGGSYSVGSGSPSLTFSPITHAHPGALGDSAIAFTSAAATATNNGVAITVDNTTNDLAYVKVIFIKSDGSPTGVPSNAYGFFTSDTLPTGWTRVQGNKYLKGADTSGDGGGTGGANTHTHLDNGGAGHTHTQNAHTHSGVTSPAPDFSTSRKSAAGTLLARTTHRHSVSGDSQTATNQAVVTTISTDNHEPVYKKLNIINNGTGGADLPDQLILLWGGANGSIPADWSRVTAMDGNFIKGANADGESNVTTGGSATHGHTASNCQPTQNSHTHNWSDAGGTTSGNASGSGVNISASTHTHAWTQDTNGGVNAPATNNSIAVTIDTSSSEAAYPSYRRVIFVKYTTPAGGVSVAPMRMSMGMGT